LRSFDASFSARPFAPPATILYLHAIVHFQLFGLRHYLDTGKMLRLSNNILQCSAISNKSRAIHIAVVLHHGLEEQKSRSDAAGVKLHDEDVLMEKQQHFGPKTRSPVLEFNSSRWRLEEKYTSRYTAPRLKSNLVPSSKQISRPSPDALPNSRIIDSTRGWRHCALLCFYHQGIETFGIFVAALSWFQLDHRPLALSLGLSSSSVISISHFKLWVHLFAGHSTVQLDSTSQGSASTSTTNDASF
jgi:hypothetical protein